MTVFTRCSPETSATRGTAMQVATGSPQEQLDIPISGGGISAPDTTLECRAPHSGAEPCLVARSELFTLHPASWTLGFDCELVGEPTPCRSPLAGFARACVSRRVAPRSPAHRRPLRLQPSSRPRTGERRPSRPQPRGVQLTPSGWRHGPTSFRKRPRIQVPLQAPDTMLHAGPRRVAADAVDAGVLRRD